MKRFPSTDRILQDLIGFLSLGVQTRDTWGQRCRRPGLELKEFGLAHL